MKNNLFIYLFSCLTVLILTFSCPLKASHYYYRQISLQGGLPSTVKCVYTEPKGFVWIGTDAGLGRFDGEELRKYIHQQGNENSLPDNSIYQIIGDNQHNIWILTKGGIARYQKQEENFDIIRDTNGAPILAYSACLTEQGVIFAGSNHIYLYRYNTSSTELLLDFSSDPLFIISTIAHWDNRSLLCCSRWHGALLIDIHTGERHAPPFDLGKEIVTFFIDSQNRIWLAPYNKGLRCYNLQGELLASYTTANSNLSNNVVLSIVERHSNIWVSTDGGGINIIQPENRQIQILEHLSGDESSLPVNSILSLYNDSNDDIWAGSIRKGLINIREVSMTNYTDVPLGTTKGLSDPTVLSLYQDNTTGLIWIGTDGGGINSFNPVTKEFHHIRPTWKDKIVSISGFTKNELLISKFSKGLFIYNKTNAKQQMLSIDYPEFKQYLHYSGMGVNAYQDAPGTVLLLTDHIYRYNIQSRTWMDVEVKKRTEIRSSINAISHDKDFTYLNDSHSLYRLERSTNQVKTLFTYGNDTLINSVSIDEKGRFWIGSNTGLGQFDPSTNQYRSIPTSLFSQVNSVICDQRGKIWIGAENMLFAWLLQSHKFILFGESDGVIPNEYLFKPRLASGNGEVYMGGVNGLLYIDKNVPIGHADYPEVKLIDIRINGENAIGQAIGEPAKLTTSQHSRNITLHIMSHEQDILRKKRYRYLIQGTNNEVVESYDPELTIRLLPAGNYQILASCSTKNGEWTPPHQILVLTILPPWYKSNWFIFCLILFIVGCITLAFFIILRHKENRLKWSMKEKELREYEKRICFLVNISNELLPSLQETDGKDMQIIELIRNRLHNEDKNNAWIDTITNIKGTSNLSKPDETFLQKLNRLITDHIDDPKLDVAFLYTEMGLSRSSLYSKLKVITDMGANDYINKFRMEKAILLILTTDLNVTEIAERTGYTTARYFSTAFKQYTGETPTQYKERVRKAIPLKKNSPPKKSQSKTTTIK